MVNFQTVFVFFCYFGSVFRCGPVWNVAGQPVQRLHSFCQAKDENLVQVKASRKKGRHKRSGRFYSAADVQVVEEMLEVWKRPTVADIKAVFFLQPPR